MADDNDDPFSVVKPSSKNIKMSQYIKRHKQREHEDSASLATNSTRSTTVSTRTDDSLRPAQALGSKSSSDSISMGFGSSGGGFGSFDKLNEDSQEISFCSAFGDGLEFGSSGNDIGFETKSSSKNGERRKKSSQKPDVIADNDQFFGSALSKSQFDVSGQAGFSNDFEDAPIDFGSSGLENVFGDSPFDKALATGESKESNSREQLEPRRDSCSGSRRRLQGQSQRKLLQNQNTSGSKEGGRAGPPTRMGSRRLRRASLEMGVQSGLTEREEGKTDSIGAGNSSQRVRRGSLILPQSMDGPKSSRSLAIDPPQRHKSLVGTSMNPRPASFRASSPRHSVHGNDGSTLGSFFVNDNSRGAASSASVKSGGSRDKGWAKDRSKNQEKILNMYKDSSKSRKDSRRDLGASLSESSNASGDVFGFQESSMAASIGSSNGKKKKPAALAKEKKLPTKKDVCAETEDDQNHIDARNLAGRSRGTLLERVCAGEPARRSESVANRNSSSYSDRILMKNSKGRA